MQQRSDWRVTSFTAQEFCSGGTLLDWIRGKPAARYSALDALRWLRDISAGMDYLHRQGGIHRDLKPENVLLDGRGRAKVADFGLFRMKARGGVLGGDDTGL